MKKKRSKTKWGTLALCVAAVALLLSKKSRNAEKLANEAYEKGSDDISSRNNNLL